MLERVTKPFDERLDLTNRLRKTLLDNPVPLYARRYYYCFGGIAFFLLLIQVITGFILAIYYVPSTEKAYASVYYISRYVNYGWLVRSVHYWSANLMIVLVLLHMLRVFLTSSYKPPREFNWIVGMSLLGLTLGFSLTGYLLPWDQRAFWTTTVTVSLVKKVPVVGEYLHYALVGGEAVGQPTLTRFFSFHVMLLPALIIVFLIVHFWIVRKQGISRPL